MSELGLVRYDAMCKAIAACYNVDEVKELRGKARALEVYAKQALNRSAERKACEIRIRAERRAGQLLKEMSANGQRKTRGRPPRNKMSRDTTLSDIGITRDQSSTWQELAEIPENEFEAALARPLNRPSTEGILGARRPVDPMPTVSNDSLWLWGTIRDFEREGMLDKDPEALISGMLDTMQADMTRILPTLFSWLNRIGERTRDSKFGAIEHAERPEHQSVQTPVERGNHVRPADASVGSPD